MMLNLSDMRRALPDNILVVALIILVLFVNLLFIASAVLPRWRTYEQLSSDIAANEDALRLRAAEQDADDMKTVMQSQVEKALSERDHLARILLTPQQADSFVEHLFSYADAHGVEIINMQAQETSQTTEHEAYEVRTFRLQAAGSLPELVKAIAGMEELSSAGIALNEIYMSNSTADGVLTMTIEIYASPYASGSVINLLSQPEQVVEASLPDTPLQELTINLDAVVVPTPDEPIASVVCPGTLPSPFRTGDTVVVDFHEVGALRILEGPSGFDTLTQVYDGTYLRLLDGPVCGTWRSQKILYWLVEIDGLQGWVGEGDSEDRWICPLSNPECAQ